MVHAHCWAAGSAWAQRGETKHQHRPDNTRSVRSVWSRSGGRKSGGQRRDAFRNAAGAYDSYPVGVDGNISYQLAWSDFVTPTTITSTNVSIDRRNQLTRHGKRGVASCWPTGRYLHRYLHRYCSARAAAAARAARSSRWRWRVARLCTRRRRCTRPEQG